MTFLKSETENSVRHFSLTLKELYTVGAGQNQVTGIYRMVPNADV